VVGSQMQATREQVGTARSDTLALLYQGIFTGIVRIQSGKQGLADLESFRRRMKGALLDVERDAGIAGYDPAQIREAEFAVIAFLDEAILSSKDPKAEEWRKKPLNIDLFGQAVAGDVFFEKLADIERRRDSPQLADLLEVYLLCLLLGFEGRFGPPLRGEAHRIMERLRARVETIRSIDYKLSPPLEFPADPATPPLPAWRQWRWWALGAAGLAALFFLYWAILSFRVGQVQSLTAGFR
jgi:type VI secretion system protein ImpK